MIDFRDDAVRNHIRYGVRTDIETYWQTARGPRRYSTRLSPSNLGGECAAETWFGFRWVTAPVVPEGKMERYNSRGEKNEADIVAWLRATGWTVEEYTQRLCYHPESDSYCALDWSADIGIELVDVSAESSHVAIALKRNKHCLKQWAITNFNGHMYGKCDGIASHPVYTEGVRILLEFKYVNDKRYTSLISKPLITTDLKYYNQVMIYLRELGLPAVMFVPANRNNEDLDFIILPYDGAQLDLVYKKAETILTTKVPPAKIAQSAAFYKCKFCEHVDVCHNGAEPAKNCRSCVNCMPTWQGEFYCEKWGANIPKDTMPVGCHEWLRIV